MKNAKWYKSGIGKYSGGQGLVIDETTGENIAVTYKVENSALVAAAPDLRAARQALLDWGRNNTSPRDANTPHALLVAAREAIDKAEAK